jgi:hypothetical protein
VAAETFGRYTHQFGDGAAIPICFIDSSVTNIGVKSEELPVDRDTLSIESYNAMYDIRVSDVLYAVAVIVSTGMPTEPPAQALQSISNRLFFHGPAMIEQEESVATGDRNAVVAKSTIVTQRDRVARMECHEPAFVTLAFPHGQYADL